MVFEFRRQGYKKTNKEKNNSNIPNEYAKIENSVKGEQKPQVDTDHTYGFIDEFIEEAINASKIHEYTQETDYDYWISVYTAHANISIPTRNLS
jgi:hypothetical protein